MVTRKRFAGGDWRWQLGDGNMGEIGGGEQSINGSADKIEGRTTGRVC